MPKSIQRNVVCVIGTRPEAIKMAPIITALKSCNWAHCIVVITAQHRDLLDQTLAQFRVSVDHDLDLMKPGQKPSDLISTMLPALEHVFDCHSAHIVLAQGDTTTAFVSALAAFHQRIPFGHVEAGLRTYNLRHPFPEEGYRQMASRIALWHFAPTNSAAEALRAEGILSDRIYVTGNTGIDSLLQTVEKLPPVEIQEKRLLLLTAHRRENFGEPLQNVFRAVRALAERFEDLEVVFPVHPNPNVKKAADEILGGHPRIRLVEPMDYFDFIDVMRKCTLILSDSGGIQEEAPALGKPVLILRETTERPEAIEQGHARLIGTDEKRIVHEVSILLKHKAMLATMSKVGFPFGDGAAANRILRILSSEAPQ